MTHKFLITMIAGLSLLMSPSTRAGTARSLALGGDEAYFEDTTNVLRWYADLSRYPDLVLLEMGDIINGQDTALSDRGMIGHGGGVHVRLDEAGRWGTAAFYFQDHLPNGPSDGAFSALYGRRLGNWRLGLAGRFTTHGQSRNGTDIGDRIDAQYFHQYGLGLDRRLSARWQCEIAGEIINSKNEVSGALNHLTANDWKSFGLRLRLRGRITPRLTLVPVIDHNRRQGGYYSDILAGTSDLDARLTSYGLAANLEQENGGLLIISGEYRSGSQDWRLRDTGHQVADWTRSDRDFYQLRGRAGIESPLFPWLTVRAAIQYVRIHDETNRSADAADEYQPPRQETDLTEEASSPVSLGFGVHRSPVTVDFTYNDTAPLNSGLAAEGLFMDGTQGYSALTLSWSF